MEEILNIPLTFIQLRSLYLLYNKNIINKTNKRPDITIQMIKDWLKDNGYQLKSIKIYNVSLKKNMKFYKITF